MKLTSEELQNLEKINSQLTQMQLAFQNLELKKQVFTLELAMKYGLKLGDAFESDGTIVFAKDKEEEKV